MEKRWPVRFLVWSSATLWLSLASAAQASDRPDVAVSSNPTDNAALSGCNVEPALTPRETLARKLQPAIEACSLIIDHGGRAEYVALARSQRARPTTCSANTSSPSPISRPR